MKINMDLETPPVGSAFKDHPCIRGRQKRGYRALQTREKICQKFGVFFRLHCKHIEDVTQNIQTAFNFSLIILVCSAKDKTKIKIACKISRRFLRIHCP